METHKKVKWITLEEKRRIICGLSEEELQSVKKRRVDEDIQKFSDRVGLSTEDFDSVLADLDAVETRRLDPNRVSRHQLRQFSRLNPSRIETILSGRPFYSMGELESATGLSRSVLNDVFNIPAYRFTDKTGNKRVEYVPVPGRYIVPEKEFEEAADLEELSNYRSLISSTADFQYRVIEPSNLVEDFVEDLPPHHLKRIFKGDVHPVVRDAEGFERVLIPGSLDIWFTAQTYAERRHTIIKNLGLKVTGADPSVGYYRTKMTTTPDDLNVIRSVLELIDRAQDFPEVAFAEPDQLCFEDFEPNQWVSAKDDDLEIADRFWNHDKIDLGSAHAITQGASSVVIIIVDSGMRVDHQDLATAIRSGWQMLDLNYDFGVPESAMSPDEHEIPHGTKVSGVVGGQGPEDMIRVRGIAPGCRILPVKISGRSVIPAYGLRAAAIRKSLTYIRPDERAVLNLSWKTNGEHIGIREALKEANDKGFAIVASAGNYLTGDQQRSDDLHYPSAHTYKAPSLTGMCSVAATGPEDKKAIYSYYGLNSITVSAPGGDGYGAGAGIYTTSTPDDYGYTRGTSFSSPHVAGLIALIWSVNKQLSAEEVIQIMKDTADPIDDVNPMYSGWLGAGRINAGKAVTKALETVPGDAIVHRITASAGAHGSINPEGEVNVSPQQDQTFFFTPDAGYRIKKLLVDGANATISSSYTFTNVTGSHTITVAFEPLPLPSVTSYTITADAGPGGTIDPVGMVEVQKGTNQRFSIKPYQDYRLKALVIDGANLAPASNYTFSNVTSSHTINAVFESAGALLNINTATAEELNNLPFIGAWLAQWIITYREAHGPFTSISDLRNVGLNDATINELEPYITV